MTRSSNQIRTDFIEFFKSKGHTFVRSAPVVPQDDPTLLFTNAGMNQFKAIFLGENREGLKRVANSQKCMRVSGKHNDLEEVGRDHHHHTFFEMLGNWSFGDYYKKEAIVWAWELLTQVWGLPKEKLYATVHTQDDEAFGHWTNETDIDPAHILRSEENFWEMGETGPCGSCSEVHIDRGPGHCVHEGAAGHTCGVGVSGCGRFIELWNLVFMQNNREKDGALTELPAKNIDTGMGFERVMAVLQNVKSNYDTDVFRAIISATEKLSGKTYGHGPEGTPFRVIADHIRSLTFAITDGAFPSNLGRGYVLRRLLRRACRFGRELGFHEPFLYKLVSVVVGAMGEAFPEIQQRQSYCEQVIRNEEERFVATLEQGIALFEQVAAGVKAKGGGTIAGPDVFQIYDTYGFPMDLTRLMAEEKGLSVDESGFDTLMAEQRSRSRDAQKKAGSDGLSPDGWVGATAAAGTEFVGYTAERCTASVARFKVVRGGGEEGLASQVLLVLDKTPFYAESGGQMGDTGTLTTEHGLVLRVEDTLKWNDMIVHRVGADSPFPVAEFAAPLQAAVDAEGRGRTRRNHSATHLLQAALRKVLGSHVQQSGSRVDAAGLRFDFTHFKGPSDDELAAVERLVNTWVCENRLVSTTVKPIDEAKAEGATALFGEKYGDNVRVVSMDGVSKELCGGTHVAATGQIGTFHITAESSIAAGTRRIEAVTGLEAYGLLARRETTVRRLALALKVNVEKVEERVTAVLAGHKELEDKLSKLAALKAKSVVRDLIAKATQGGAKLSYLVYDAGQDVSTSAEFTALSDAMSDEVNARQEPMPVFFLGARVGDGVMFAACTSAASVTAHGVNCGELVREAAKMAGGGGGGKPIRAQAGGKRPEKFAEALAAAKALLAKKAGA
jgi:alanyl-tRNA synthetase